MICSRLIQSIQCSIRYFAAAILLLLLTTVATHGQNEKRLVRPPECPYIEEETILELTALKVAGKDVPFDEAFAADNDWLQTLVFRVKNIGDKPIAAIVLTFGLLERVDEELPASASFEYGLQFIQRMPVPAKQTGTTLPVLVKPGEEVEITAIDCRPYGLREFDRLLSGTKQKRTSIELAAASGARFRKAEIMGPQVQFTDGTVGDAQLLVRSKCKDK